MDGGYSDWVNDGPCSAACGDGKQRQLRTCDNPVPANGGLPCFGPVTREVDCNEMECPLECKCYCRDNIDFSSRGREGFETNTKFLADLFL